MCELTLVNTNDNSLNQLFSLIQPRINSETINKDGFGVFTEGAGVKKTIHAASNLIDGGTWLRKLILDDRPVLLHTRAASKGIAVVEANVHPFETEDFVLAHNGTLYLLNEKVDYSWPKAEESRESDSLMFLKALQKNFKGDVVSALQEAMKLFKGKFAFLIYHKKAAQFYAVRGKTADLHMATLFLEKDGPSVGYIINTSKSHLEEGLSAVSNIWQLAYYASPLLWEVKELTSETIFLCEKTEVKNLGEIKETAQYTVPFSPNGNNGGRVIITPTANQRSEVKAPLIRHFDVIKDVAEDNHLSIADMRVIVETVLGTQLHLADEDDFEILATKVFPQLVPQAKVRKFLDRNFISKKIKPEFFKKFALQFPIGANKKIGANAINRFLQLYAKEEV